MGRTYLRFSLKQIRAPQKRLYARRALVGGMPLTISSILDICDYVKCVCLSHAVVMLIALNQESKPLMITEIIEIVARESKGHILLRDQSIRDTIVKLKELNCVMSTTEPWGIKRTRTLYSLTEKGRDIVQALEVFCKELMRRKQQQAKSES